MERFGRGAGARHADLGGDLLRRRRRRCDRRHAADRRGADLRLRHPDDGHDRQPGGQVPLHAGRAPDRAAGDPRAAGRRHPARRAAQPEPGGLVRARAGPRRGGAVLAVRRQGPADRGDPRRQPGDLPRAQAALSRPGRAGARAALRDPARQGGDPAAGHATSRSSRPRRWCSRRCRRRPGSRARASAPR